MQTNKQPQGSKTCLLSCVEMIVGADPGTIPNVKLTRHEDTGWYLSLTECIKILADYGYMMGARAGIKKGQCLDDKIHTHIELKIDFDATPAILTVPSANLSGQIHCVVWDNEKLIVRDPNPKITHNFPLNMYEVLEWWPVWKITE